MCNVGVMLLCSRWKNWQVCQSSAMDISVMGFVNLGSGRKLESVKAIMISLRGGMSNDIRE